MNNYRILGGSYVAVPLVRSARDSLQRGLDALKRCRLAEMIRISQKTSAVFEGCDVTKRVPINRRTPTRHVERGRYDHQLQVTDYLLAYLLTYLLINEARDLRRVLHFLSSLVLTSYSRDFSLSVQDVILDNLGSVWLTSCLHN